MSGGTRRARSPSVQWQELTRSVLLQRNTRLLVIPFTASRKFFLRGHLYYSKGHFVARRTLITYVLLFFLKDPI